MFKLNYSTFFCTNFGHTFYAEPNHYWKIFPMNSSYDCCRTGVPMTVFFWSMCGSVLWSEANYKSLIRYLSFLLTDFFMNSSHYTWALIVSEYRNSNPNLIIVIRILIWMWVSTCAHANRPFNKHSAVLVFVWPKSCSSLHLWHRMKVCVERSNSRSNSSHQYFSEKLILRKNFFLSSSQFS